MTPGTRVRFNEHSSWPERVGYEGVVVDPARFKGRYPADKPKSKEVIVLLDLDPLDLAASTAARGWTCVTSRKSLTVVHRKETAE